MSDEDKQKLAKLSKREREVLWLVCEGNSYEEISKKLFISIPTVKANMGRVYVKLGLDLDQMTRAERLKAIHQTFCSLMREIELPPEPPEPTKPEPVPENVAEMVNEDERSIIPYQPPQVKIIDIKPLPRKTPPPRRTWRTLILGLILGAGFIVCLAIIYFVFIMNRQQPRTAFEQPTAAPTNQPIIIANTVAVPQRPTSLPVSSQPPTTLPASLVPTQPPVPSIALPFSDNFDSGSNPLWKVLSGDWITVNGRYSVSNADYNWGFSVLDDPSWTNYQIKVNVLKSHPGSAAEGEEAIIVRYLSSESQYLVFYLNTLDKAGWAIYDGKEFKFIAGYGASHVPTSYNLEIDANGNEFVAKINGMEAQRISMSGYEKGGVGLGVMCAYTPCSSFNNFQVSPVP
jgi:DNA-binding CsgD family transcriptional regulator